MPVDTESLARALIGRVVVRRTGDGHERAGKIVETEAYVIGDASSHAFGGETARNASMFREPGFAYVYFIYGTAYCLNVSSERAGVGAAVLIRALEPIAGLDEMRAARGDASLAVRDLARGPGRLCRALEIDRRLDALDLCTAGPLYLAETEGPRPAVGVSTRIGLSRETDRALRFYERSSRFLSGPRALSPP